MKQDRREFLKKSGCALSMVALATQMEHFGLMNAMAQKSIDRKIETNAPDGGYKALVCVYLSGGSDMNNVVIPNHSDATISNYATYAASRSTQGLALTQASLLPIAVPRMGGLSYGLHPALGTVAGGVNNGIHELWALGKMAIVPNVGNLVFPMTRAQWQANSVQRPYQMFSHSDQVEQSQAGFSGTTSFTGWGGRLADKLNQVENPNGLIPMVTSISGAQLYTNGQVTLPMAIANAGTSLSSVLNPSGFNSSAASIARRNAMNSLRTQDLNSNYIAAASHMTDLAIQANATLQTFQEVTVAFPNTSIGNQLKQVARLIKKRSDLSVNRQVFYVQLGGFDTHTNQLGGHANLLTQLSQALRSFYNEMVAQGIQNDVTTFTLSDFGRTMSPAGSGASVGTDHAWGNHMFVVGGGVLGGNFYGVNTTNGTPFPTLTLNGPDDADSGTSARGRWIPTTSVDQYAATLATWFGLPPADFPSVLPNLSHFPTTNLGFMA